MINVFTSAVKTVDWRHLVLPEPEDELDPVPGDVAGHVTGEGHGAAHQARDLRHGPGLQVHLRPGGLPGVTGNH